MRLCLVICSTLLCAVFPVVRAQFDDDLGSNNRFYNVDDERNNGDRSSIVFRSQNDRLDQPTFVITAAKIVRPNTVYRVNVVVLPEAPDLNVKATITKGRHQVASDQQLADAGSNQVLLLPIPASITNGDYRLKVVGYDPQHPQKAVFAKEGQLEYYADFVSIVVQSNRKIYRNEMNVRFRVILTQMDLRPYTEPVDVYVLDPGGFIMRRWPSRHPTNGVISLVYKLPSFPSTGKWVIRVQAQSQIHDYQFVVERYYILFFEVIPSAPAYVLDSDETYPVAVTTSFHPGRVYQGNITLTVMARPVANKTDADYRVVRQDQPPWVHDLTYDVNLREVQSRMGVSSLTGWMIRVAIELHHNFMGETRDGFIDTRVIKAQLKFRFVGPRTAVFKPGMPFEGHLCVAYDDDQSLSEEKLAGASLVLRPVVTTSKGQLKTLKEIIVPRKGQYVMPVTQHGHHNEFNRWMERQAEEAEYSHFRKSGVYRFRLTVPNDASSMRITAMYADDEGDKAETILQAVSFYSETEVYVHLTSSTEYGAVGHNAIFHLKSNTAFQFYNYVVISKGLVIHGATVTTSHATRLVTFAVPISTEMAPTFKLVASIVSPLGELVADSVTIPVGSINRYKMNVTMVQTRDHSKQTVQVVTKTTPGAYIGISLSRSSNYIFQADNELTPNKMLRSLYNLEPFNRSVHGITWSDREGMKPDRSEYLRGSNPGSDSKRTFNLAGLLVFTDARVSQYPDTANCDRSNGYEPCMANGCFHKDQRCNGKADCSDGSDEDDCPTLEDDRMDFRMLRRNRFHDYYDWLDGDWAWFDIPITEDGIELYDRPIAMTNEVWFVNGFSYHADLGFTMLDEVVEFDGSPPFYFSVEAPGSIRRGETLGIRLLVINNLKKEIASLIILEASSDYCFVETGPEGEVEHYQPDLTCTEKHHVVYVKPESMLEVYMPIAPRIEKGTIVVNIQTISQIVKQRFEIGLDILPEGATISRHTSLLLDLKNRAHVLRFLDIPVEESPIIPYSKFRRYVFGSPRASVQLCGDVFGPVFPVQPLTTDHMLGRSVRGTEADLFVLAATSWSLHYLRLTNQLDSNTLYSGLEEMNYQMADLMRLYHPSGSFRAHRNSQPSVWVTAWVVRVLGQSQFQDWENHYFVDRKLLASNVRFILSYQNRDGTFTETDDYQLPIDRRLGNITRNVAHTAHVLIGLSECSDSLEGSLKVDAATAKVRAVRYLERMVSQLTDPYDVAIVAHALTLTNSPAKEAAFGKLHSMKRETDGMVYWGRKPVPTNKIVYENQRPFIQPRLPNEQDALAVETTAYALLVYLARDGIGDLQERTVGWLNTMRMVDGGFVSIYDTVVAMEALTEYAYRARLREITEMSVLIDASASPKANKVIKIRSTNLAEVHHMEIPNVWGHVNIIGRGAGQAVLQLKVEYGVDWEDLRDFPDRRYFDLYVEETYSHFGNKSHIIVDACVKWLAVDEAPSSGAATLEIELPSGYALVQTDANGLVESNEFAFVRDVLVGPHKVVWLFDKIGPERLCIKYEIHRWFPVANMTMYRSAVVYESHSPEHFEMQVFNATPLYVLDICEVCGSFQCPYCPYFSSAPAIESLPNSVFIFSLIVSLISLSQTR